MGISGILILFLIGGMTCWASLAAISTELLRLNHVSKPAHGNMDETDAWLPLSQRIAQIDNVNDHADQCRAVLGPIPKVNCLDGYLVPVTSYGSPITYHDRTIFRDGKPTDWTDVPSCDRPALLPWLFKTPPMPGAKGADPTEGCLPNVRFGHYPSGSVDWLFVCHYKKGLHEPTGDAFDFIAMIGSNSITGETCFFAHDNGKTDGVHVPLIGAESPSDVAGRKKALAFWNNPAHNTCLRCHGDNKPWIVTPHLNQSRLDGDGSMDIVPTTPIKRRLRPQWGYRVIGVVHNLVFPRPRAIYPRNDDGSEDHTCTRCHVLTDQEESLRLAREAVGLGELPKYRERNKGFFLTRNRWMPPDASGTEDRQNLWLPNELESQTNEYQGAVKRFQRAFYDEKFREATREILSPCPQPAGLDLVAIHSWSDDSNAGVRWTYRHNLGNVPLRDDVRFEVRLSGSDGTDFRLRDLAPDSLGSDQWSFRHPRRSGVHYSYGLRPYRYCFDRYGYRFGSETKFEQ